MRYLVRHEVLKMIRLSLKLGGFSLDYEGEEQFLKNELTHILEAIGAVDVPLESQSKSSPQAAGDSKAPDSLVMPRHSTNTVAKLLNASSGPDLIMAAVAKVILVDAADTVTRKQVAAEMRKASSYFKRTYMNNLSAYLDTLTKADKIRLVSEDTYGLPAKERERIEHVISES